MAGVGWGSLLDSMRSSKAGVATINTANNKRNIRKVLATDTVAENERLNHGGRECECSSHPGCQAVVTLLSGRPQLPFNRVIWTISQLDFTFLPWTSPVL
jgi:hypothetical protein